ncbi:MAG: VWA domain-containing protein [Pyrinomonadaceae bacterium]
MTSRMIYRAAFALLVVGAAILFPIVGLNQSKPSSTQSPAQDDIIRVNTELVQTDVTVFDKKGRFVDGLTASDFELVIDGKPQDISFFERVAFYNTERGRDADSSIADNPAAVSARQRTVLFFVDDLHLSPTSIVHTRKSLLNFVNQGMLPNDQVAITSSSGQIGFLQQFTGDRTVLQAAVARLNYRANAKLDMEKPPMSEFQASKIQEGDESAISYYVAEMMKQGCFKSPSGEWICFVDTQAARTMVIQRARQITMNTAPDTKNTLLMLEGLMRTAAQLPGRKLMFLISDGFYLNDPQTGSKDRIKKITDAAGRAGVVIYTLDARGLITEGLDVLNDRPVDSEGLTMSATMGDIAASQDGLNALARDTGGEAFRNTNRPMGEWVRQVLDENSTYYILAWRPLSDDQKGREFKNVKIRVKGRPELTARMRRGYFRSTPLPMLSLKGKTDKGITERENDMRVVIDAPVEQRELKAQLIVSLAPMPGVGTRVLATVEIDRRGLAFDLFDGKPAADIDIGGIFYDDKGKPKNSFVGRLRVSAASASELKEPAVYRFQAWLPAGLYQVRVGLRDTRSGKTGSAVQWIKVPAL